MEAILYLILRSLANLSGKNIRFGVMTQYPSRGVIDASFQVKIMIIEG